MRVVIATDAGVAARIPSGRGSAERSGTKPSSTVHGMAALQHPLDAAQQVDLVDADQADRLAHRARPAGPADAMDVVLRVPRQLEVDDDREVLDIETACRDIGRHEDPDLAGLEALERPRPFRLRAIAVDRDRVEPLAVEARREPRGRELGAREDEDLVEVVAPDEVGEQEPPCGRGRPGRRAGGSPSTAVFRGATSTVSGSRRIVPDSRRMSSENVAENIRFWRCFAAAAR